MTCEPRFDLALRRRADVSVGAVFASRSAIRRRLVLDWCVSNIMGMIRPLRNLMTGIFAAIPDPAETSYAALRGLPKSFGFEAGEWASQGVVQAKSKDGWCIATLCVPRWSPNPGLLCTAS